MNKEFKTAIISSLSGALAAILVFTGLVNYYPTQQTTNNNNETNTLRDFIDEDYITQEDLVISAVEKAQPAVVSIMVSKDIPVMERYYEEYNSPFDFFGRPGLRFPQYRDSGETQEQQIGGGSGFIVSENGYIITNKHVVSDSEAQYTVITDKNERHEAQIIDLDPLNDLAVIKIDAKDLPYLEFADSSEIRPGQSVIAIGNPLLEFNNSVSVGVISGLSRSVLAGSQYTGESEQLEGVIQTDAAINPGNSGGPLLNLRGEVIGVNVAVATAENIGFSLPSNLAKSVILSIRDHGEIIRPYIGVRYIPITETLQAENKLSVDYGVLVVRGATENQLAVIPGSPADKAGLVENDIILEVDGKKLNEETSLARIIAEKNVGDTVELKILHRGNEESLNLELERIPKD